MKKTLTYIFAILLSISFSGCATWDGLQEDSANAWEKTKEVSSEAWEKTKDAANSN